MSGANQHDNKDSELAQVLIKHMDDRFGFWQEYMEDRFGVLQENVEVMIDRKLQPIADRLKSVELDVKVIKAVITGQSSQLDNHEERITTLESKSA